MYLQCPPLGKQIKEYDKHKKRLRTDQERGEESKRMEEEVTDLPHSTVSSYEEKTKRKDIVM